MLEFDSKFVHFFVMATYGFGHKFHDLEYFEVGFFLISFHIP